MRQSLYEEIMITYDNDSQGYYCIWQPLTSVGMGRTQAEALEDLRAGSTLRY